MRLALYQPDIPQNVGAAIRAAACFGAEMDVIEPCGFPLDSREVRRVAMDYRATTVPRPHKSWSAFLETLGSARLVLLTTKAEATIWDFAFEASDVIIMGRESVGAPDEVHKQAEVRLRIPLAPGARSLNLATASAVTLAEMRRQLGWSDFDR